MSFRVPGARTVQAKGSTGFGYGTLANGGTEFMELEADGEIDVYQYSGINGVTFLYSDTSGENQQLQPIGIAQRP